MMWNRGAMARALPKTWLLSIDLGLPAVTTGSLTLKEYPRDMVVVTCDRCDMQGKYRKARLISRYGPDIRLPDMLRKIAPDCEKRGLGNDQCGVHYDGL